MQDFIDQNITGTWDDIKNCQIVEHIYVEFKKLTWDHCYFALNVQRLDQVKIPTDCYKKIVISFHTEYFEHQLLWEFFNKNSDCEFLFLCDQSSENIWPLNVTQVSWNTWGYQLDVGIQYAGINHSLMPPTKKISSLSNRHEFHKAAVTAYLVQEFNNRDMIISWNNWICGDLYYQHENFFIPDQIKKYLSVPIEPMILDKFDNYPLTNTNWNHPAYVESAINLTNESIFNSQAVIGNNNVDLPTPYLTEKTWKPLLSGRPFIPVGQYNTLKSLENLGFVFDYNLDLSFDQCRGDFDRMLKIYQTLNEIKNLTAEEIFGHSYESCLHNLQHIRSGSFSKNCYLHNMKSFERIESW